MKPILPPSVIGIIGGGQLGKMMAMVGMRMGYKIVVLDGNRDCAARSVCHEFIEGGYDDKKALLLLAKKADVITFEFENIPVESIEWLILNGGNVAQGKRGLEVSQNRWIEKRFIRSCGLKTVAFEIVKTLKELDKKVNKIGFPCILKTCENGYDGKGQIFLRSEKDIALCGELLSKGVCILEAYLDFEKEVSMIFFRNKNKMVTWLPLIENIHVHGILHQSIVPARVETNLVKQAIEIGQTIIKKMNLIGTLAIEMFVYKGELWVNELAPRPHNSGHFSIEGCLYSQFEEHIKAICNLPFEKNKVLKNAVMTNILGQHVPCVLHNINKVTNQTHYLHLYGKDKAIKHRKMGHWTLLGDDVNKMIKEGGAFINAKIDKR